MVIYLKIHSQRSSYGELYKTMNGNYSIKLTINDFFSLGLSGGFMISTILFFLGLPTSFLICSLFNTYIY